MAHLYEGRQAKTIQRRMVIDACRRLTPVLDPSKYQYVGFGGLEFGDFVEAHTALGVSVMTSIEQDTMISDRVDFNKPYAGITIHIGTSTDMLPLIDWSIPAVTWLDYTCSLNGAVLNDVDYVVRASQPGSLLVVTVHADVSGPLSGRKDEMLRLLGASLPTDVKNDDLKAWGIAGIQRDVLQARAETVAREAHRGEFDQLFNFHYQDQSRMLTWGGIVSAPTVANSIDACHFDDLRYVRRDESALEVRFPSFTDRERRYLEREISAPSGRPKLKGIPSSEVKAFESIYRWRVS